MSNRNIIQNQP